MANYGMPAGPGQHMQNHPAMSHPRRQPDFAPYHHPQPQSPIHHPYAGYPHPGHYYSHPHHPPPHYTQQRWQHPYAAPQSYMPSSPLPPQHQQAQYQPRSPMVVTSQPYPHSLAPLARQPSMAGQPVQQPSVPSPRPSAQHVTPYTHTPVAPPSPAPTPNQDSEEQQRTDDSATPSLASLEQSQPPQPISRRQSSAPNPLSLAPEHKMPFYPKLPWYSTDDGAVAFPQKSKRRRRRRQNLQNIDTVALPSRDAAEDELHEQVAVEHVSETSTVPVPSELETPATSQAPSESECNGASTPTTPAHVPDTSPRQLPAQASSQHARRDTRTAIAVPNIPGIARPKQSAGATSRDGTPAKDASVSSENSKLMRTGETEELTAQDKAQPQAEVANKPTPKSWADLVRRNASSFAASNAHNGPVASTNGVSLPKSASLSDALRQYDVKNDITLSFLEPRGLVNTGNMCYMNSILQVLVFCTPFYSFLDQVRQRTVHSMNSITPLLDAMIMFMREFKVLATADSAAALRASLAQQQLEQYGDPITPQYVYDAISKLERFHSMRRGHQQDAEEFLGFLLEGMHDECVAVMATQPSSMATTELASPTTTAPPVVADGWMEVGPKQKASVTRTEGQQDAPSPVTKMFGGHLRSVLRVPGNKDSVVLEPYKPLPLDIGAPHVNNIVDALKGLTRTESLTGDFGGRAAGAKKQVFIESLPPVLILHLKRFQYDNNFTGTQKIWKKVGYPLELEIPKEVFSPASRNGLAVKGGMPKYRLTSVVYHHGKSAAGGHYTVDILREDGREWIRMDDTVIRRIRPEDVAEGGAEEDPKLLAKALEQHKADQELQKQRNMYEGLDEADREPEEEKPWNEVNANGHALGHRKWSSVANPGPVSTNGTATPVSGAGAGRKTPTARRDGVKDNKVAYILLYERLG